MNVRHWLVPLSAAVVFSANARSGRAEVAVGEPPRVPLVPSPAAGYPPGTHYKPLCPTPDETGRRCYGQILVDENENPITHKTSPPGGWTPTELEAAYGLSTTGGQGTVIATYIGSHYTNAESDAAAYRSKFGMSACTSASGCFTQVTTSNDTDFSGLTDDGCNGDVGEESLDMDMLMAGCPSCKILIIEGGDNAGAISTAKAHGAVSISMSWGYTPESESDCQQNWVPPSGLALFAASGDKGYTSTPGEPGACTDVIAVGWTQLATATTTRGYADTLPSGWGSAGGCDTNMTKASWQTDKSCSSRMISDISANGDNVAAYCTSPAGSADWHVTGGSSAASPFSTGVLANLGVTKTSGFNAAWIYENADKFSDVTSGGPVQSCPSGSPTYFCNAVKGYDGPTGVGTPYGPGFAGAADAGGTGPTCVTPSGTYSQSCTGCAAEAAGSGCELTCISCTKIDGSQNPNPTLTLPCKGSIVNDDGALQCVGGSGNDAGSGGEDGGSTSVDASLGVDAATVDASSGGRTNDGGAANDNPGTGAGGASSSAGCGCTTAGSAGANGSAALVGGLVVVWGWRRKRASHKGASAR
jgi:MYXO-CTERM domain-containing protein